MTDSLTAARRTTAPDTDGPKTLHGWRLIAAWVVWIAVLAVTASVFFAVSAWVIDDPAGPELTEVVHLNDASDLAYFIPFLVVYIGAAVLILRRRLNDPMALVVGLALATFPFDLTAGGEREFLAVHPGWRMLIGLRDTFAGLSIVMMLLFVFPNGRFVPRWTLLLLAGWVVLGLTAPFVSEQTMVDSPVHFGVFVGLVVAGVLSQVYRYGRVSGPVERQQTKWVILGLSGTVLGALIWWVVFKLVITPGESAPGYLDDAAGPIIMVLQFLFPVCLVFAVVRYRLYDIDVVVNRALVYGLLTAVLVGTYFGVVVGLQAAFRASTGQDSNVAIVISTLLIAALFLPLRRRLQEFIDRRFYRRRYDAARTLASFAATARDEVDLERLSGALVAVVRETMEPAHVSLWLREDGAGRRRGS